MIGKPCARKSHARFDEGELEIELLATTPALYSTLRPLRWCGGPVTLWSLESRVRNERRMLGSERGYGRPVFERPYGPRSLLYY